MLLSLYFIKPAVSVEKKRKLCRVASEMAKKPWLAGEDPPPLLETNAAGLM